MAKRYSTALQNAIATRCSINDVMNNGVLMIFSGTQPSTANLAYNTNTSVPLMAITEASGVITKQVDPYFSVECSTTGTDSLTSFKVSGIEILGSTVLNASSASTFATNFISSVNNNNKSPLKMYATLKDGSTTVVLVHFPKNTGASMNVDTPLSLTRTGTIGIKINNSSLAFATGGGLTDTSVTDVINPVTGYCIAGVNGINLLNVITSTSAGKTEKETGSWSGVAGSAYINTALGSAAFSGFTTGTAVASWFRYYTSMDDPELSGTATDDSTGLYYRYDGSVGDRAGYDMIATGGTTLEYGATNTTATFSFTVPASQS